MQGATPSPVNLQLFQPSHLPLLATWLREPHVARWYPRPDDDLARAMKPPAGAAHAIIGRGAAEVGYIRWQHVDREQLDAIGLHEIPANSVDIDILLGSEEALGRGLGPAALAILAADLRRDPDVPLLGLTTSVENTRAHRAFEKAGFRIARQYEPAGLGPCHLMIRDLRPERGGRR
ncbi:MAG TPA: GNAT family N-acetyltransferase [Methylomirabilota bacterium]|nr:GNAT family N-acetyltransferase [Methylomirabilota bacterium]